MKKSVIIIQSPNGENKSSIIRAFSQLLISLGDSTVLNLGELGLTHSITSVVEIDDLKIGVASQNTLDTNALQLVKELEQKGSEVIFCAMEIDRHGASEIETYCAIKSYNYMQFESNWSAKLEVNYLEESQMTSILNEIKKVNTEKRVIHLSSS